MQRHTVEDQVVQAEVETVFVGVETHQPRPDQWAAVEHVGTPRLVGRPSGHSPLPFGERELRKVHQRQGERGR